MLLYFSISVSSSHPVRIWQSGRDCYVVAVLGYVMRFMTIRPCCLSKVILLQSFTELAPADLIWSAQYVGYLPQGLEPSALPWTIRRSMGWSPCRELNPKNERTRGYTVENRIWLIPSSWSIEIFVWNSIHEIPSIFLQHHISKASILCLSTFPSFSRVLKYRECMRPHEPGLCGFSNVPVPAYFPHLVHRRSYE